MPSARLVTRSISFIHTSGSSSTLVLYDLPPCSSTPSAYLHSSFVPHPPQHVTNHVAADPGAVVLNVRDGERSYTSLHRTFNQRRLRASCRHESPSPIPKLAVRSEENTPKYSSHGNGSCWPSSHPCLLDHIYAYRHVIRRPMDERQRVAISRDLLL